jgi:hypothetical protein
MWADTEEELDRMARLLWLKPEWKQRDILVITRTEFTHYDLTRSKRELALKAGAVAGDLKAWLKKARA